MTNEQKHEIAKLFWDIPYCEVVVDDEKRPKNWEYSLPEGTLCVLYKLSDDDVDYETVCHLLMENPKDKRIRELEAELAAIKAKEPLYDPVSVRFDEIFGNPRRASVPTVFHRSLGDAIMDGPDFPAGPEVTCNEDDGA